MTEFKGALDEIVATSRRGTVIALGLGLAQTLDRMERTGLAEGTAKMILIGNGGSAAIASHIAIDYMKNGGFRTLCFTDPSMLTCFSNDYGYEYVYEKPISRLGNPGDMLIAISSSGRSKNILNAVKAAIARRMTVVTCSGFDEENPLRTLGEVNFYVPSHNYPAVEGVHMTILDSILQASLRSRTGRTDK